MFYMVGLFFLTNNISFSIVFEKIMSQRPWDVSSWDTSKAPTHSPSEMQADLMITFVLSYTGKTKFLSYPGCLDL